MREVEQVRIQEFSVSPRITIIHGDCMDVSWTWSSDAALITDPPYGMDYKSNHNTGRGNYNMKRKDGNFNPIHGDAGEFDPLPWLRFKYVCLFGANHFSGKLPSQRGWLVWDKLAGKTPCQQSDCELAWTNTDNPVRMFTHLWRGIMRAGEKNVSNGGKLHPHQKPVALMVWVIDKLGLPEDVTVYDPFMGSGTIGVACHRLGYRYVGVEICKEYFESAKQRLLREAKQPLLGT